MEHQNVKCCNGNVNIDVNVCKLNGPLQTQQSQTIFGSAKDRLFGETDAPFPVS